MSKGTHQMNIFIECLAKGMTKKEAYFKAYPKSKNWKNPTLMANNNANMLLKNPYVIEKLKKIQHIHEDDIAWTRKRALEEINYLLDQHRRDLERIDRASDEEIMQIETEIEEITDKLEQCNYDDNKLIEQLTKLNKELIRAKKKIRATSTNTNGIIESAKLLNRMFGYDSLKEPENPVDVERNEMEANLTIEELRKLANG